jgi:hypothetical protein
MAELPAPLAAVAGGGVLETLNEKYHTDFSDEPWGFYMPGDGTLEIRAVLDRRYMKRLDLDWRPSHYWPRYMKEGIFFECNWPFVYAMAEARLVPKPCGDWPSLKEIRNAMSYADTLRITGWNGYDVVMDMTETIAEESAREGLLVCEARLSMSCDFKDKIEIGFEFDLEGCALDGSAEPWGMLVAGTYVDDVSRLIVDVMRKRGVA